MEVPNSDRIAQALRTKVNKYLGTVYLFSKFIAVLYVLDMLLGMEVSFGLIQLNFVLIFFNLLLVTGLFVS